MFISHYEKYPIYEPAEGGYYYEGWELTEYAEVSEKDAQSELDELFEDIQKEYGEGYVRLNDRIEFYGKHIGEGDVCIIESVLGENTQGKKVYC